MAILSPGQRCGRFTILAPLEHGPLVERYIALDERDPDARALLAVARRESTDSAFLRTLARLKKSAPSGAPRVLSGGSAGGVAWVATQHIIGPAFSSYSPLHGLPPASPEEQMLSRVVLAVGVGQVVGSTLKRLAERGFVHGQLDPRRNIVVSPANEAYVLEAGYSLLFGEDRAAMLADPMYRAPEQLHGAAADHRSDIYSLGLSLHAYIAGEPPFHADDPAALLARCREGSPRPLAEVVDSHRVKRLSALLAQATAADPAARLQSWSDLLDPLSEMIATMLRVGERKGLLPDQGEASPRRRSLGVGAPRAAFRDPSPERLGRDAKRGAHRARLRAEAAKLKKAGEGGAAPSSSEGGGDAGGSDKEPSSGEDPPASDPLKPPRRPE